MGTFKLFAQKYFVRRNRLSKFGNKIFLLSVVDTAKGSYPSSFVCNLPIKFNNASSFSEQFEEPVNTAILLLKNAREDFDDLEVQQEIDNRLRKIERHLKHNPKVEVTKNIVVAKS